MRSRWMTPALLGLCGLLPAQDAVDAEAAAKARYAECKAAYEQDYQASVDARRAIELTAEYRDALEAKDWGAARSLMGSAKQVDMDAHVAAFVAAAEQYAETETEVEFLCWLMLYASRSEPEVAKRAFETMRREHIDSERASELISASHSVLDAEQRAELLAELVEKSPHAAVRAQAKSAMVRTQWYAEAQASEMPVQELLTKYEAEFEKAASWVEGTALADQIRGPIFERDRLQIGMQVPEIEGEDLDGVPFKLSDYRGKVVLIDFWGDW